MLMQRRHISPVGLKRYHRQQPIFFMLFINLETDFKRSYYQGALGGVPLRLVNSFFLNQSLLFAQPPDAQNPLHIFLFKRIHLSPLCQRFPGWLIFATRAFVNHGPNPPGNTFRSK